jgi:hypothetical protein
LICYVLLIRKKSGAHSNCPFKGIPIIVRIYCEQLCVYIRSAHCHTLPWALPHTATHCLTRPCALPHTASHYHILPHSRTLPHCHTRTAALPHTAENCRTAAHCRTPSHTAHTLPCTLPHTTAHYCTLPHALPHTAALPHAHSLPYYCEGYGRASAWALPGFGQRLSEPFTCYLIMSDAPLTDGKRRRMCSSWDSLHACASVSPLGEGPRREKRELKETSCETRHPFLYWRKPRCTAAGNACVFGTRTGYRGRVYCTSLLRTGLLSYVSRN